MIGALFHNYEYRYYGGDYAPLRLRTARIDIELNAVPGGEVEFVLAMPTWMQESKGLIIHESPQAGQGVWEVAIDANSRSGRNGLYAYQIDGAYLEFTDGTPIESWRTFVWNAPLGSRVHFNWVVEKLRNAARSDEYPVNSSSIAEYSRRRSTDHTLLQELGAVPADQVEFVLENQSQRRIDMTINESPSVGGGMWSLSTDPSHPIDQNGLYMYQIRPGASMVVHSYSIPYGWDRRVDRRVDVIDISDAIPGTRYTFKWMS